MTRTGQCNRCGECCRWVGFFLNPDDARAREWARARALRVKSSGLILIPNRCPYLTDGGDCILVGPEKPENCRVFPQRPEECLPGCGFGFVEE